MSIPTRISTEKVIKIGGKSINWAENDDLAINFPKPVIYQTQFPKL